MSPGSKVENCERTLTPPDLPAPEDHRAPLDQWAPEDLLAP
jgi:hypothetical protein